jgi:UDP-N-acetylmuramoyl-tripeptide--D-alanyl-D-alanine ligase
LIQKGKYSFVLDAYNANPTSTKAALMSFAQKKAESKGIILGDMLELGVEAFEEHQKIVFQALAMKFEEIYLVGSLWPQLEIEHSKIKIFEASEVLRDYFVENPSNVTTLLLKGSRGIALEKILDAF